LAILLGVTAAVDIAFDVFGFGKANLVGVLLFVGFWIVWDLFAGETPSQRQREEER
jgi:hypothetical protein